jgi:hypothetical protein
MQPRDRAVWILLAVILIGLLMHYQQHTYMATVHAEHAHAAVTPG